jgi:hypothetical protein
MWDGEGQIITNHLYNLHYVIVKITSQKYEFINVLKMDNVCIKNGLLLHGLMNAKIIHCLYINITLLRIKAACIFALSYINQV